ncbi:WD40 repeat domain-containing protein [Streptomyces fuscichromogenes]|uniref:Uncharacterized protein n=1 Tax=Streptomyces fuscichromogenes TaxID=1324013 RepID=A0A917UHI1_9ACTN|nr:WD40 repeat domain-containing protein [Streptomyces fuscichromogenes]GGM94954.1 hypothetical protein GCM10011578_014180 [Streptomyces fuscichromogenes]
MSRQSAGLTMGAFMVAFSDSGLQGGLVVRAVEVLTVETGYSNAVLPLAVAGGNGADVLISISGGTPEINRWDLGNFASLWCSTEELPGYNSAVLAGLSGGQCILAVSTEEGVERWNALTGEPLECLESTTIWGMEVAAFPDGRAALLGAGQNCAVYRWDIASGEELGAPLLGHTSSVLTVGLVRRSAQEAVIVSGDDAGYLRRWDATTGAPIGLPIKGHTSAVKAISCLGMVDGRSLFASSDATGDIFRWDGETGERVGNPLATGVDVHRLATACPGGIPLLFAAGNQGIIRTWHAYTGERIDFPLSGVSITAFDQVDGSAFIAVGTVQGEIIVYSLSG